MLEKRFPILNRKVKDNRLVYLDSASTTQKPRQVIGVISNFYEQHNANIHRGIYQLSLEATELYENARDKVQKFINARHREEIIFTSGATEAINLVAWTWGHESIKRGDEILLSEMEHHSNLVPWQILAKKKGAKLRFVPISKTYNLQLNTLPRLLTSRTKLVALTHVSNVLGTINPVEKITKIAHQRGAKVLIDGAQAGGHVKIDVQKLGCDFYVLSGHKMYGPTGVGVLYSHQELLEKMPPYQYGGHMIKKVSFHRATWNDLPYKFEAGTANIAEVIGLGATVDFLKKIGMQKIQNHELLITNYAIGELRQIPGIAIYNPAMYHKVNHQASCGIISFILKGLPPHDLANILDERGIAIRTGHHCAMPLHEKLEIEATARVSLGIYNTKADIDKLIKGIKHAIKIFSS